MISLYYPGTNYIVDLDFGKTANGTKVQLWTFGHCQNQYWTAESFYTPPPEPVRPFYLGVDYVVSTSFAFKNDVVDLLTTAQLFNKKGGTVATLQSDKVVCTLVLVITELLMTVLLSSSSFLFLLMDF